ncbi:MAG: RNA-binding protein [Ignavibacteria bacterium]|nr:RNA-binding protein [Ignavibacteria bacterium]
MNLFVGNVDFKVTEEELSELFGKYGEITSAKIITDRNTGRSRGFAFVEMENDEQAKEAIKNLNGYNLGSRELSVSEARPKEKRRTQRGGYNKNFD